MLKTQKWCIDLYVKQLVTFQAEALDSCQKMLMMSPTFVRNREPFGARNFARALSRVTRVPHFVAIATSPTSQCSFWHFLRSLQEINSVEKFTCSSLIEDINIPLHPQTALYFSITSLPTSF